MPESNIKNNPSQKGENSNESVKNKRSAWNVFVAAFNSSEIVNMALKNTDDLAKTIPEYCSQIISSAKSFYKFTTGACKVVDNIIEMIRIDKAIAETVWESQGKPNFTDLSSNVKNTGAEIDHMANKAQVYIQDNKLPKEIEEGFEELSISFSEMLQEKRKGFIDDALMKTWELLGKPSSINLLENVQNKGTEFDHMANKAQSFAQDTKEKITKEMEETIDELSKSFVGISKELKKVDFDDALEKLRYFIKGVGIGIPGIESGAYSSKKSVFERLYDATGLLFDYNDIVKIENKKAKTIWERQNKPDMTDLLKNSSIKGTELEYKIIKADDFKKDNTKRNIEKDSLLVGGGLKMMKFATGGLVDRGELFIAREAGPELVGMIGNSAAVMNNEQIVDAVARGVASAIGNQRVNVNVDGKSLFDIIVNRNNAQVRQTGLSPLMG